MRIVVVGAGGVGGYYGGVLARGGHEVVMVTRAGAHLDALRSRGLEIRTPEERFTVAVEATDDARQVGRADLVIVAVKNYSLQEVAPAVRLLAEAGADVLPLLNGVEVVERLQGAGVAPARLLGGLTQISAARIAPGIVERRIALQKVIVGELAGGTSARAEKIARAFEEAGLDVAVSTDITADVWRKFAFIASAAAGCGLARSPLGAIRSTELGHLLFARAVAEVFAVARLRGVKLDADEESKILRRIDSLPAEMKPSFLLDLEAGGPTELDDLSGAVSRLGRQVGVETPVHDTAEAALAAAAGLSLPGAGQAR